MKFTGDAVALKSANELAEILDGDSESEKESFAVPEGLSEQISTDGRSPHLRTKQAKVDTTQFLLSPTEQRLGTSQHNNFNN